MSIRLGDSNPLNPLIAAATSIEEEIVHQIVSIPTCFGCAATQDSLAPSPYEENRSFCDQTVLPFIESFALTLIYPCSFGRLIFDCIRDFFSDFSSYFLGDNALSPEAIVAINHLWVNRSRIYEASAPIEDHFQTLSALDEQLPIDELNRLFLTLFDDHQENGFYTAKHKIASYVRYVAEREARYSHASEAHCDNLQKIVRLLILELRKDEIPLNKKKQVLLEIADARSHCAPRIYEESQRQWKYLTNRITTLDEKFKQWLQILKEDIVLERYQSSQFHVLNNARRALPDWGLDQSSVNLQDRHINMVTALFVSGINYRYTLNREYSPERIVSLIRDKIIDEGDNTQINTYFQDRQDELRTAGLSHQDLFESDGTTISYKGAAWLLKMHNFLY